MITKVKSKKNIIIIFILIILLTIGFICYGEMGINKPIPKRAKYVNNLN